MKKFFTFLLAAGSVTFASAQSQRNWHDDKSDPHSVVVGQHSPDIYKSNTSSFDMRTRDKEEQIQRINREFDMKISAINFDRRMRFGQKRRMVRQLEQQRSEQIRQVEMRYSHDRDSRDDRHDRKW